MLTAKFHSCLPPRVAPVLQMALGKTNDDMKLFGRFDLAVTQTRAMEANSMQPHCIRSKNWNILHTSMCAANDAGLGDKMRCMHAASLLKEYNKKLQQEILC